MKKIITISREYGSGGHIIGETLAKNLGYDFYDNKIIDMAAEESGLSPDFIKKTEQNLSSGWLYNLLLGTNFLTVGNQIGTQTLPLADQVFNAERNIILKLAEKPCVIVGRCADYILKNSDSTNKNDLLNIFIYADLEDKIQRAIKQYSIDEKDVKKIVQLADKRRANHYNTFTEDTWGDRKNYDLLINSSTLGVEQTIEMLTAFIKKA